MNWIEVVPAYGRDYKSQAAVKADWKAGKDFQDARTGQYLNNADVDGEETLSILARYAKLTKVVRVK